MFDDSLVSIPVAFSDALISSYKVSSVQMNQYLRGCFLERQKSSTETENKNHTKLQHIKLIMVSRVESTGEGIVLYLHWSQYLETCGVIFDLFVHVLLLLKGDCSVFKPVCEK